jgi:hypothetical protein
MMLVEVLLLLLHRAKSFRVMPSARLLQIALSSFLSIVTAVSALFHLQPVF